MSAAKNCGKPYETEANYITMHTARFFSLLFQRMYNLYAKTAVDMSHARMARAADTPIAALVPLLRSTHLVVRKINECITITRL